MKIGANPAFANKLLGELASASESGNTISKPEATKAVDGAVKELMNRYLDKGRTAGLKKDMDAVRNTFQKALDSGWVKNKGARAIIEDFVDNTYAASMTEIRDEVRSESPPRRNVGYARSAPVTRRTRHVGT